MYEFIVKYQNMITLEENQIKVDIDTISLDSECMDNEPEIIFAWKIAVEKAHELMGADCEVFDIELLSY